MQNSPLDILAINETKIDDSISEDEIMQRCRIPLNWGRCAFVRPWHYTFYRTKWLANMFTWND